MPIIYRFVYSTRGRLRYDNLDFCHNCGSREVFYDPQGFTKVINNGGRRTEVRGLWACADCCASVAAHHDGKPQGYLGNAQIKRLRYEFHVVQGQLLAQGYTRDEVSEYLSMRTGIPSEHMHAGWMARGELIYLTSLMHDKLKRPDRNVPNSGRRKREHKPEPSKRVIYRHDKRSR